MKGSYKCYAKLEYLGAHRFTYSTMPPLTEEKSSTKEDLEGFNIEERQLGVWTLRTEIPQTSFWTPKKLGGEVRIFLPLFLRLFTDIFNIAPYYMIIYLACRFAEGLEDLLILGCSDKLLRTVRCGSINFW